ncbi:MAG: RNA-binding transcriptional accessory protein, partial [Firmicutes bacterium]|nr:RNA-binding transcriptional accessory protein [Bacillota bacterium]
MALDLTALLAQEFSLKPWQVQNTVQLFDDGNTIPFIARYRKERTGELDEEVLRKLHERLNYLRALEQRKQEVLRLIAEQEKLTPELAEAIKAATKVQQVEDLYRPFRPKRRTRATIAKERGLEPLAEIIWAQDKDPAQLEALAAEYVDEAKEVPDTAAALAGARDILAERIADDAEIRQTLRELTWRNGELVSTVVGEDLNGTYQVYRDYREPLRRIPPHRILAVNRGEKEEVLRVQVVVEDQEALISAIVKAVLKDAGWGQVFREIAEDAYKRLIAPSLERELRNELTETAEIHAIEIFAKNLRALLLQPPVRGRVVMGIDPGYRTGCKVAVVNEYGDLLETATIYPHSPQKQEAESKRVLSDLIDRLGVTLIAIGNGTASRETEQLVADLGKVPYLLISEAGASVYSASPLAREELPDLDVSMRGAVSIARRVQDPLAELVKIDPKSIGVGQYQHDVNQNRLAEALAGVVESCVNYVGVDLNSASAALLGYVAGITAQVAKNIVAYRQKHGPFKSRRELLKVSRLGPATFQQCAGFLRIPESENFLDNTAVHPESYELAQKILEAVGDREALKEADPEALAQRFGAGVPTLRDIIEALLKPGRDPRDEMPAPILRTDILSLEDLKPGMQLKGTVRNVVDFGAFVDIGVKQDGLVHISELSDQYVKHPLDVVSVGDVVDVRVLDVDLQRKRIA